MQHGTLFYLLLGASVVVVPAMTDRLLKDRVSAGWRAVIAICAAGLAGAILVLIARPLGL
jgi:hypothetical protein